MSGDSVWDEVHDADEEVEIDAFTQVETADDSSEHSNSARVVPTRSDTPSFFQTRVAIVAVSTDFINTILSQQLRIHSVSNTAGFPVYTRNYCLPANSPPVSFELRLLHAEALPNDEHSVYRGASAILLFYSDNESLLQLRLQQSAIQVLSMRFPVILTHIQNANFTEKENVALEVAGQQFALVLNAKHFSVRENDIFPVMDSGLAKVFSYIQKISSVATPPHRPLRSPTTRAGIFTRRNAIVNLGSDGDSIENRVALGMPLHRTNGMTRH